MKKLKIILLLSGLILLYLKLNKTTYYKGNEKEIIGIVMECQNEDNYTKFVIKAKEKIIVYFYDNYTCNLGDNLKIDGALSTIDGNRNFNLFNYKKYMLSKGIYWKMIANKITVIKDNKNILYHIKNKIREKTSINSYLSLFILGENNLDGEIKESYQINGVSHLFAISGMHVTLFITVLTYLLNKMNKHAIVNKIFIIFFLLFYMFLTNFSISIVRSSFLSILLMIKQILNLKISSLKILSYICFFCLCYNPYLIYQVGFIFTFLITFTFLLFSKDISKYKHYFTKLFITSSLAFIVSIPILINHFFQVNFLTPFLNLLFIPLITFIIFPLTIITFIFPFFLPILEKITVLLEQLSLYFDKIQILSFSFAKIPFIFLLIYYLIIFIGIYFFFQKKYYLLLLIPILIIHYNITFFISHLTLTMIDIGQGDSLFVQLENNKGNILIDTGGNYYYNQAKQILFPYFKSVGIHKIDYLILTHGDYDHMGEAINLVDNFKVEKVIFNCGEYNDLEKELIKVLDKKNIKYYSCIKELNIDKCKLQFLNTKEYDNENDNSSVIYLNYNNYKFLFMGDAGVTRENDILKKYNLTNIDFLKVGHHGSNTSSSKEFINSINPKYSLISVGKNNRYGHPKNSILETLSNSKIYRTDIDGSIEIKLNKNGYKIRTCPS